MYQEICLGDPGGAPLGKALEAAARAAVPEGAAYRFHRWSAADGLVVTVEWPDAPPPARGPNGERLWIKAEPAPGCDIRDAARLAVDLARRLGVGIEMDFNRETLLAVGEDEPDQIVRAYLNRLEKKPLAPPPAAG